MIMSRAGIQPWKLRRKLTRKRASRSTVATLLIPPGFVPLRLLQDLRSSQDSLDEPSCLEMTSIPFVNRAPAARASYANGTRAKPDFKN